MKNEIFAKAKNYIGQVIDVKKGVVKDKRKSIRVQPRKTLADYMKNSKIKQQFGKIDEQMQSLLSICQNVAQGFQSKNNDDIAAEDSRDSF